jgi:ABC-2 type transport system ATP-binding protein
MVSTQAIIQVEHLCKRYGSTRAVDDISFAVQPGEIFGIIGPNGAGKTTTVEILSGMRSPDSGIVCVLGLDPQRQVEELRQKTGVQLQAGALPDQMRVWEALDLFHSFYRHAAPYEPLIRAWGLEDKRNTKFMQLSGGQKQRLFIALALINDPELVFLDELTSGLDPQARRTTWDLVRAIRVQGKTVVLVTHFMDEAEKLCDRVAIIDQGRLMALDTPQGLMESMLVEQRVRFTTHNGFNPAGLRSIPGVTRAVREGDLVTVAGKNMPGKPSLLLQVATALEAQGMAPVDLSSEQPNLEDVFLSLTGRQMRD